MNNDMWSGNSSDDYITSRKIKELERKIQALENQIRRIESLLNVAPETVDQREEEDAE